MSLSNSRRSRLRLACLEDRHLPTVGGVVFADAFVDGNLNGHRDGFLHAVEPSIPGVLIFADSNGNGQLDPGEPSGVSPGARFDFAADGDFVIRSAELPGARRTSPAAVTVHVFGGGFFGAEFGFDVTIGSSGAQELLAVGADAGGGPHVKVFGPDGTVRFDFMAYDPKFRGGVRVATADVTGDGTEDIITAPGPGGGPHIKIFDGRTGNLVREWMAYDPAFTGGVYIAAWSRRFGAEPVIATGAGPGGGPHVRLWDPSTGESFREFLAYDPSFRGGVTVALADLNSDSEFPEVITGAGPGGGPHVKVFDGQSFQLTKSFFAFDAGFLGGVTVAAMDTNHDGRIDIVIGAGAGGAPLVRSFDTFTGQMLFSVLAFDPSFRGGVRVGTTTIAHQLDATLVVAPGPGGVPFFRVLTVPGMQDAESIFAFDPAFLGGVFVG